jgi:uncharacterized protein (DUF305 family)
MYFTSLRKFSLMAISVLAVLLACNSIDKDDEKISMCGTFPGLYQSKYHEIMETMHRDMENVIVGSNDNINFLRQMIPHHQGAIEMSEVILQSTTDCRIKNIAKGIITEQRNEIAIMNYLIHELEADTITNAP